MGAEDTYRPRLEEILVINVFIAEDEVTAREQIKLLVGKFPAFQVIGEAGDGDTASEMIKELHPDLLFTDIRMPGKNGLELLADVRGNCPLVELVVISGYSDFEYAKGAIQNGCLDYLLKPVSPRQFREMMERLEELIVTKQMKERTRIFEDIVTEEKIDKMRLNRFFPFPSYHIALVRKLGLPGSWGKSSRITIASEMEELNCIYGRDWQEALYLWPEELLSIPAFENRQREKNAEEGYCTVISYMSGIKVEEIPQRVREMYKILNQRLVLGKSQFLRAESLPVPVSDIKADFDREKIENYIQRQEWKYVNFEIEKVLGQYEKSCYPLYKLETAVNHLLADLSNYFSVELDYRGDLEETFCYAKSMDELITVLEDYIKEAFQRGSFSNEKIDTEAYFEKVIQHVQENLNKPITLQQLSDFFGMSSSYMSRLFKKYAQVPFNEYLTRARIQKACQLFKENPDCLVKDAAGMVGIPDQFYFSRLFRSITGDTPTQYAKKQLQKFP